MTYYTTKMAQGSPYNKVLGMDRNYSGMNREKSLPGGPRGKLGNRYDFVFPRDYPHKAGNDSPVGCRINLSAP